MCVIISEYFVDVGGVNSGKVASDFYLSGKFGASQFKNSKNQASEQGNTAGILSRAMNDWCQNWFVITVWFSI